MTINWTSTRQHRFAPDSPPPTWPRDVLPISTEGLVLFGIQEGTGELYWDGKPVQLQRKIRRGGLERIVIGVAALATIVLTSIEVFRTPTLIPLHL
jgi:hypothetical protein